MSSATALWSPTRAGTGDRDRALAPPAGTHRGASQGGQERLRAWSTCPYARPTANRAWQAATVSPHNLVPHSIGAGRSPPGNRQRLHERIADLAEEDHLRHPAARNASSPTTPAHRRWLINVPARGGPPCPPGSSSDSPPACSAGATSSEGGLTTACSLLKRAAPELRPALPSPKNGSTALVTASGHSRPACDSPRLHSTATSLIRLAHRRPWSALSLIDSAGCSRPTPSRTTPPGPARIVTLTLPGLI